MGLLTRLFQRAPQWQYPPAQVLELAGIDQEHNYRQRVRSRTDPDKVFEVNLYALRCSCPNFRSNRRHYGGRDVRRICPHLLEALRQQGLDQRVQPVLRLVMEHGRTFWSFHRIYLGGRNADIVFGFEESSPIIRVFAVIDGAEFVKDYNLDTQSWMDGQPLRNEMFIRQQIERTFSMHNATA